ncbi:MAG: RnfABCDGE type electron transport complex subunit G [Clostridiales bacterium]|nr:RnfABCDGE type electron transport complex subunit G [Clostridiales bacterium]
MKKFSIKEVLIPTISLFAISLVVALILAVVNGITDPLIKQKEVETENETKAKVLSVADSFDEKASKVKLDGENYEYYTGYDKNKAVTGYVFKVSSKGYGGDIVSMIGIDKDGNVTGVEFLSITETVGLGMNADKDDFKNRFKGKNSEITVVKNSPKDDQIQALTGATITSNAVTKSVNTALKLFEEVKGNG